MRIGTWIIGIVAASVLLVDPALAQDAHVAAVADGTHWVRFAAAFGIGIAVFGGALGQSRACAAALDGIARNPGAQGLMFTPMIIGLALIESLVLLAFLICGGIVGA
jgi:F-type H+-transporting ATPase subunit c